METPKHGEGEPDPRSLRAKTVRGFSWASAGAALRAILQFLVLGVLARVLTPDDYGVMSAALIVVGISTLFAQMGVGPALVQMKDLEPIHIRTAMTLSICFGVGTLAAVWLAAPLIALGFRLESLTHVVQILAFVFPVAAVSVVAEAFLQREMEFKTICINDIISYVLGQALVSIVLAYMGWGYMALVIGFLTQALLRTVLMVVTSKAPIGLSFDVQAIKKLFSFSFLYTVSQFANYVALNADSMIVGRYFGASGLGFYGRAYQIVVAPAVLVGDTLDRVFFPAVSRVQDSAMQMAKIFEKITNLLSFGILPVSALLIILAEPIVLFLLGHQWDGVIAPLRIFSLALFFRTTPKFYNAFIKATGRVSRLANYQLLYAACVIGFGWIGSYFGIVGVALGVLTALVTWWYFMTSLALNITDISWRRYLGMHVEGLIFTAIVGALSWMVVRYVHSFGSYALVEIASALIVAAVCGLIAVFVFPGLREVKSVSQSKFLSLMRKAGG